MTEDFKIYAKDYIAGSVVPGEESTAELFYGNYSGFGKIYEDYDYNAVVKCVKQVVSPKNVGVMWTILILWSNVLQKGRFVILDELNEIVTMLDEYESGADIGCYYGIDMDEKGRLYGIEYLPSESRLRFIMLNNIAVPKGSTYYADIRKTYNVPNRESSAEPIKDTGGIAYLNKIPDVAKYSIITLNANKLLGDVYTFEIGEAGATTWKQHILTSSLFKIQKPYITNDNNNMFSIRVVGITSNSDTPFILRKEFVENDTTIAVTENTIGTSSNTYISKPTDIIWIDYNNILVPFTNTTEDKLILQKININTETTFTKVYEETFPTNQLNVLFQKTNNYNFMYVLGINDIDHGDNWKESIYHIFDPAFGSVIQNDNIFEKVLNEEEGEPFYDNVEYFLIQNQYNLYNHSIAHKGGNDEQITGLYVVTYQEIYNENNYNGAPYFPRYTSACKPQQFILKNDNKIYYARDIYNKTAYSNIVDVSLQIPNNLVNDVEINNEQLWSTTKIVMNNENKVITKNKYEELILTIRNKLNIINDNDGQNILLPEVSARVNQCIAGILSTSYMGMYIKYAKINYHDNTTENIATITSRTDNISTISFSISVSKEIDSIDLISYIGFKYITITPTLEIGKTYTISQDVRIGD